VSDVDAPAPTVGIAIPFWSGVGYLSEALTSLVRQTDRDWSAFVIDDASSEEGAGAVVADLADPRITYRRNETNLGLAANFNRCLAVPETDVVAILHADDLLEPEYVATVRSAHRDEPSAACVAPLASAVDARGHPIDTPVDRVKRRAWPREQRHVLEGDSGLARIMHAFFVYTPAISYRPGLLPEGWFDTRWRQVMDVDLIARLLFEGGSMVLDRTPVYRYRRHAGTVTSRNAREFTRLGEETEMAQLIANRARSLGWGRTARAARARITIRINGSVAVVASLRSPAVGRGQAVRDILSLR
jgi:glycosyltransferase involved in cell wall biosynthesis